ncbi:MAG: potassium channel beta subunit family protein, partial [Myxococcaceae bacterium]
MNYRRLGKAGLKVSELSLGSWVTFGGQVGEEAARSCMQAAYDAGVNFFDGAEAYAKGQAEVVMGNVLKKTGWRREGLVLSTKVFWGGDGPNDRGLSHKHVIEGVHAALRRWQVDYLDLVFCHRPDPETPIEETVRAMDLLVKQGKVFYWGTSEWSAPDIRAAFQIAAELGLTPPSMEQPQYNVLVRERFEKEYAPLWKEYGYGSTIWSPLASGVLTGKYDAGIPADSRLGTPDYAWLKDMVLKPEGLALAKALAPIAADLGCTRAQLALAWCLKNPHVSSVITGATRAEQVQENLKSAEVAGRLT